MSDLKGSTSGSCDEKSSFFNYEGEVTSINESFCQFTLDNKYVVLACDVFEIGKRGLPKLNDSIILKNVILLENNFIHLNDSSEISCSCYMFSEKSDRFCWQYLEKHNFNFKDIQLIIKTISRFKKLKLFTSEFISSKTNFENLTIEDIFLNLYSYLPHKFKDKRKFNCNFNDYDIIFPYKFLCNFQENYAKDIEELTYTIQKSNDNQFFLGYLTYNETSYSIVIIDDKHEIICQILNHNNKSLKKYLNQFILIKKYYYIIEYYKEKSEKLEYLLFDINNVQILLNSNNSITKEESPHNYCIVLQKCPIYYHSYKKKFEIWLYVKFPKNKYKCFISSVHLIDIYHLINVGSEIKNNIPENVDLTEYFKNYLFENNIELNRAISPINSYKLPPSIWLEINENIHHYIDILPIEEVLQECSNNNKQPVNFIATIQSKGLSKPLSSRTGSKIVKNDMFGTPGTQTHFLRLEGMYNKTYTMTIYLNNMENSHCQLGLIPGMKVHIYFAIPQNKYLKSCMTTYIQPVEYKPLLDMNTRIDFTENFDWGEPTIISTIVDPPYTARLWGQVHMIEIREIKFYSKCVVCKELAKVDQKFCCGKSEFDSNFKFNFRACDVENFFYCVTEDPEVFKVIFGLSEKEVKLILNLMSNLRYFEYKFCEQQVAFENVTSKNVAVHAYRYLEWLCMCKKKIYKDFDIRVKNAKTNYYCEQWYCVEARNSIEAIIN